MKRNPLPIIIFVLIVVMITFVGCTSKIKNENFTPIPISNSISPTMMVTQVFETPCPQVNLSSPWITINTLSPHCEGDVFEINGTTNFGTEKKFNLTLHQPHTESPPGFHYSETSGYVSIETGKCGINRWTYQANLEGYNSSNIYDIIVEYNNKEYNYSYLVMYPSQSCYHKEGVQK